MSLATSILDELWQNVRYAGRRLAQNPGFTCTAVFSLAIGIGANTAIFSLVNAVLFREAPFRAPEELVNIYESNPDFPFTVFFFPDYQNFRDGTRDVFTDVLASRIVLLQVDRGGRIEMVAGEVVSGNYFTALGMKARVGRTLAPEDDRAKGAHPVVMLGYGYWQRAFGGDPNIIGKEIRLGGRAYTIVGVAPANFSGTHRGIAAAIFAPLMMVNELQPSSTDELKNRGNHSYFGKGRLKTGTTMAHARAAAAAVAARLTEMRPESWDPNSAFTLVPTKDVIFYPAIDPFIRAAAWLLMIVVGLLRILVTADLPVPIPITLDVGLDVTVLGFSLGISLLAGVVLGLAPAIQSTKPDVVSALRDESAGSAER